MVNTILKEADLFCPNSVRIKFTIYHKIKNDEAEKLKRNKQREQEVYAVIRPVVEKMAAIVQTMGTEVIDPVIVVGGATNFDEFTTTFSKVLGRKVYKPCYPQFVTPLGIAMFDDWT